MAWVNIAQMWTMQENYEHKPQRYWIRLGRFSYQLVKWTYWGTMTAVFWPPFELDLFFILPSMFAPYKAIYTQLFNISLYSSAWMLLLFFSLFVFLHFSSFPLYTLQYLFFLYFISLLITSQVEFACRFLPTSPNQCHVHQVCLVGPSARQLSISCPYVATGLQYKLPWKAITIKWTYKKQNN
jgi:hypothetical protein